jgi:ribonuclease HI
VHLGFPQARKYIATPRQRPAATIELRWRPAHKEAPGNEKADEWAKLAADEPDAHGVEYLRYVW